MSGRKEEAGHLTGETAGKINESVQILRLAFACRECHWIGESWSTVADMIEATRQLQTDLAGYLDDLRPAIRRLGEIECQLADPYRASRAELADRLQDLFETGWRPR